MQRGKEKTELHVFYFLCFFASLLLCLSGCSSYYNVSTGRQEWLLYDTEDEIRMGRRISRQVEQKIKLVEDQFLQERVNTIGQRIASVSDRRDLVYFFKVLDLEEVNATALPGGYIYVNRGLLSKVKSNDELAGVIAHEVGHFAARHQVKRLQASLGYSLLQALAVGAKVDPRAVRGADIAATQLFLSYSRSDELQADRLGARYAKRAGYDPAAIISFLETLEEISREGPSPRSYLRTHPYVSDRIRVVREEIEGKMAFEDYINIQE